MIVCVSLNPAIDRRLRVGSLVPGAVNRAISTDSFAGGKAAHVAMAAAALGKEVVWIGFSGGSSGDELIRQLSELNIRTIPVRTASPTRINDEIIDTDGDVTEILEPGGPISKNELAELFDVIQKEAGAGKMPFQLALSGSQPPNVPFDVYSKIATIARELGGRVILDTSGDALMATLSSGPDLIKPNIEEAAKVVGFDIVDVDSALAAGERFMKLGAKTIAISMGAGGMVWTDGIETLIADAPKVDVISTVGCGDSAVAGFAVAANRKLNAAESLRLAVACGTANCLARRPGQIDPVDVERLMPLVSIRNHV